MFGLRHRTHHVSGLIHNTIESAFLTWGSVLMLLALLMIYLALIAASH